MCNSNFVAALQLPLLQTVGTNNNFYSIGKSKLILALCHFLNLISVLFSVMSNATIDLQIRVLNRNKNQLNVSIRVHASVSELQKLAFKC